MLVRKLRLQRGWTQDQLAEMAGLSVRTVQRLERGDPPSLETAKSLAAVFEVDLATFHRIEEPAGMNTAMPDSPPAGTAAPTATVATVTPEEEAALAYAKSVSEFYQGAFVYLVLAVVFFAVMGFDEPVLYWVFGGTGIGLIVQGLLAFEAIRLPSVSLEKRIAEKKLGRKL